MNQPNGPSTDAAPPGESREQLGRAAVELAERGWRVFPCQPGGKRPALRANWEQRATSDNNRIAGCWATGSFNIGVACGPSGLVVVDLDTPKPGQAKPHEWRHDTGVNDGADVFAALCEEAGQPWPSGTFTVATPSGGTHFYFTAPAWARLRNTAGKLGWLIDTRAAGGYVVGPGSVVNGSPYSIVNPAQPEPLPQWIAERLTAEPPPPPHLAGMPADAMGENQAAGYAMAALRGEVDRVLAATPGRRNDTLNEAAFALGQLTAARILPAKTAYDALMQAAVWIELPPREAARTIGSGLGSGARKPRRTA